MNFIPTPLCPTRSRSSLSERHQVRLDLHGADGSGHGCVAVAEEDSRGLHARDVHVCRAWLDGPNLLLSTLASKAVMGWLVVSIVFVVAGFGEDNRQHAGRRPREREVLARMVEVDEP